MNVFCKPNIFAIYTLQKNVLLLALTLQAGFSQMPFIGFKMLPSVSSRQRKFTMNECLSFTPSSEMIRWSLFLGWLIWLITSIDFRVLNQAYIPWINSIWTGCIMVLLYYCIQLLNFVSKFSTYIHKRYCSVVVFSLYFSCVICVFWGICSLHPSCLLNTYPHYYFQWFSLSLATFFALKLILPDINIHNAALFCPMLV